MVVHGRFGKSWRSGAVILDDLNYTILFACDERTTAGCQIEDIFLRS